MKHILLACVTLVCFSASVAARQISLDAGINEIRGGDPLCGLATLNDALKQSAGSPQVALALAADPNVNDRAGRCESNLQHGLCTKTTVRR
jgi:hypothetical protein